MVTLGSAGDLHPFLAVARELVRRGHEVRLLSQAPYEDQVRAEGVPFVPVVDEAAHTRTLNHPLLWHPLHGFGVLWRHLAVPGIEPTCEWLGKWAQEAPDRITVFASPLAAGARFARDRWPEQIRLLSGYTAPMGLRSIEDPMFLGSWRVPRWVPPVTRHALWSLLDHWKLEPLGRGTLARWQRHWNTPPLRSPIFGDWLHSPDGGVALYPRSFAGVPASWKARGVVQAGFPLYQPQQSANLEPQTKDFLRQHPRVVVVYPGSAAGTEERFRDLVLPVCRDLALPCVFVGAHLKSAPAATSMGGQRDDVLFLARAPMRQLLRHASHFVHHGGIGSVALGLAAGVRQLVLASAYDQFENAVRVEAVGGGEGYALNRASHKRVRLSLENLATAQRPLLRESDPLIHADAGERAVRQICEALEAARN
ncbi:nucleotide disphospho-sugar-binding domain-containing protein [Ideonella sp. DXS29W]|uniref:Nucleotide disphospho-sugar-binding domain-containing protein n=1 Tax=Ideonella lacteola TaxID=2984193 RepID=A0ABU9BSH6_9BURK